MDPDPTIESIRAARHKISEQCDHDPKKLVEYYMKLQERHADRLVYGPQTPTTNISSGSVINYVDYYNLERYLFEYVHKNFHKNHSIGAFDFFSIVIWKANRAKSKVAKRLLKAAISDEDLERTVRRLTSSLYNVYDHFERFRLLMGDWKFRLPIASAILSVLWPNDFTVYDIRVCNELKKYLKKQIVSFNCLIHKTNCNNLWDSYCKYIKAVKDAVSEVDSLRDKDRYLWGRSSAEQLLNDIKTRFKTG
jgi:hypothetical protein